VRGLYERGFQAEDVRRLFRVIDWLMDLPPAVDRLFWDDLQHYQEERRMPFYTTPERFGMRKGMLQMLEKLLQGKFGDESKQLMSEIAALDDADKYLTLGQSIATATTLDEVRQACKTAAAPPEPPSKSAQRKRKQPRGK
jgi:hypothetical protein